MHGDYAAFRHHQYRLAEKPRKPKSRDEKQQKWRMVERNGATGDDAFGHREVVEVDVRGFYQGGVLPLAVEIQTQPLRGPADLVNRMQQGYNPPRDTAKRVDESLQKIIKDLTRAQKVAIPFMTALEGSLSFDDGIIKTERLNKKVLPCYDVIVESRTGTGKTLAYLCGILLNMDESQSIGYCIKRESFGPSKREMQGACDPQAQIQS